VTLSPLSGRDSRSGAGLPLLPVALVIAIGVIAQFFTWVEADVAWLLTVARRMNAGSELYSRDLVEFNPPLVMQLSQVAVLASRYVPVSTVLAWRLLVGVLSAAGVWLSWQLLSDALADDDEPMRVSCAVMLAAALACLPGLMFGQREHLVVLGFVPYLVAAALRARHIPVPRNRAVAIGIALALAISIKPHYALAIPLVEAVVWWHTRRLRELFRTEAVAGLVALVVVQGVAAFQFPGYLSFAVPLALDYYPAYGAAQVRPSYVVYAVTALAALFVPGLSRPLATQRLVFVMAGLGAFLGYLLQGQGWEYQFLPAQSFFMLATLFALVPTGLVIARRLVGTRADTTSRVFAWVCAATLIAGLALMTSVRTARINRHERTRIVTNVRDAVDRAFAGSTQPRSMASLTLSLFPAAPVAELLAADWGSRFSCLWLVPGITAHEDAARAGSEAPKNGRAYLESAVVEDFRRWRPSLILVERDGPRVLDEVLKSPAFRDEWRHYHSIGSVEGVELFQRNAQ